MLDEGSIPSRSTKKGLKMDDDLARFVIGMIAVIVIGALFLF